MSEVLTAAQMKAIEAAAIASGAVTGLELMERAGAGVVAAVLEEWPEMASGGQRAVVLCGPGNNGGDGFVVARLLAARGWAVEVYLYGDAGKLPPDARVNYERWVEVGEVGSLCGSEGWLKPTDLIIDALFGIGLTRPIVGSLVEDWDTVMKDRAAWLTPTVAIDVPSGLCSDSGREVGDVSFLADVTVTFQAAKVGHFLANGPLTGRLVIKSIGLDQWVGNAKDTVQLVSDPHRYFAIELNKSGGDHKFSHGHALIVSGDHGHAGAARMAARGALRIGAGLVTVASPPGAMAENAARLDAVMLKPVANAAGLAEVLADARINAVCLGPGLGLDARAAEVVRVALETSRLRLKAGATQGLRLVLDADALTLISRDAKLFGLLHEGCVLTPHAGEFARLFPDIAERLAAPAVTGPAYSKVDATREAAARAGCVVLYKGADTVIAAPDGRCSINAAVYERSAPWLATAGSGDVLAGFITGLLARGFQPMQAAETAAWLHVECARSFGPGLIAEDLPEELPKVFRALGV
ncbi:bifunctional ADP-dependent NAD(P)H-hydrate dehydratase/NAD(P)H-hydrate epimerase [Cypionkella psychrotolerans]|uniref:bifunctional ADP-dependent NAD(P)H-hydrate dehydratase/NAD(P)H-hydrate epimerase n=1 Tax=Cypionkella psychrotolerans TaxID=1678131 RepID=UPI0006B5B2C9|nr:bifunctional ADP-dependent NAD(P)H-hydrate dehydratase/NAD(P)H-hydrate epimerase [Cypionkella psychrotolerans]